MSVVWALPFTEACCVPGSRDHIQALSGHFKPSGIQALCFRVLIRTMGLNDATSHPGLLQKLGVRDKGRGQSGEAGG